jgi:uncharacterized OB-fold protein
MARPQPRFPEPDTEPFWEATKQHKLMYPFNPKTGKPVWYPRRHDPATGDTELEWRESKGEGTIYTYSVIRQNRNPSFKDLGAYAVAFVDLDEGFRMMSGITGVADPTKDIKIGQRVKVAWEDQEGGISLPLFAPV